MLSAVGTKAPSEETWAVRGTWSIADRTAGAGLERTQARVAAAEEVLAQPSVVEREAQAAAVLGGATPKLSAVPDSVIRPLTMGSVA